MSFVAQFDNKEVTDFLKDLDKKLKQVKDGKKKYVGLMSAIVHGDVMRHFEDQQGSEGPWEKWSKSYREQMDRKGKGGNKILQDTGKLKQNFKPNHYRSSSKGLYWYNNAVTKGGFPYAYAHDEGGDQLPKRDFMWLSDDALEEVGDQTLAFLLEEGI